MAAKCGIKPLWLSNIPQVVYKNGDFLQARGVLGVIGTLAVDLACGMMSVIGNFGTGRRGGGGGGGGGGGCPGA